MEKVRRFIEVFIGNFLVMFIFTAAIIPGVMWVYGHWSGWCLLSYFITLPAIIAFLDVFN